MLLCFAHGGGCSSIVKVPGDVPPARAIFVSLVWLRIAKHFGNLVLGKGMRFGNFGQEKVQICNCYIESQNFSDFDQE